MLNKKVCYVISMLLAFLMAGLPIPAITAETDNQITEKQQWQPIKNFVDPVTLKIQELREKGFDTDEITVELEKLGMGWYPKTGATWLGRALTSEELAKMPQRTIKAAASTAKATLTIDRVSVMRTSSASYSGVSAEMISGSMSVASGETLYHYATVQLGDLGGLSSWTEVLVTHNYGEAYKWYTYDSNEGGWSYYADKNTASSTSDTYVIMLDGTQDVNGCHYDVWVNYQWVRRAHLPNLSVQAGYQKEVFSNTGTFTDDTSNSIFYRAWLHNSGGWSYWTNSISTQWSANSPVKESHAMGAVSYNWQTWVKN